MMVDVQPKTVVTMAMTGACPSHARTDISVRDLVVSIDEPLERGGTNTGPSPTETMIAALIGCTNVIARRVAEKAGVEIQDMAVKAEARFDRRGVTLTEEVTVPFPEIVLTIDLTTGADDAAIETVKGGLRKYCPVSRVFIEAGTNVITNWNINRP
jgi:uncharacterized OsmC-like protein